MNHLLGILVAMLQWLQPLLTPSNYDTLVASLLQKASAGAYARVQPHRNTCFSQALELLMTY